MSEDIAIGTGTEKILGSYDDAVAYIEPMLGERYEAWMAGDATKRKKSLVNAVRFLNAQNWGSDADTFEKRDALVLNGKPIFQEAQYELAVLVTEDSTVTDAADQGSNIQSMVAGTASLTFFNSTMKAAAKLPPILMRLIGRYLGAPTTSTLDGGSSQGGSCVNPFSDCADFDRKRPY